MGASDIYHGDVRVMVADAPQPFTWNDQDYVGAISGQTVRKRLEIGGFDEEPEMILVVALRDEVGAKVFVTLPTVGEKVTVGTRQYRIDKTEIDQFNTALQLDLRSTNK